MKNDKNPSSQTDSGATRWCRKPSDGDNEVFSRFGGKEGPNSLVMSVTAKGSEIIVYNMPQNCHL